MAGAKKIKKFRRKMKTYAQVLGIQIEKNQIQKQEIESISKKSKQML